MSERGVDMMLGQAVLSEQTLKDLLNKDTRKEILDISDLTSDEKIFFLSLPNYEPNLDGLAEFAKAYLLAKDGL